MLKQIIAIIVLSILTVMAMPYAQHGLQELMTGYEWISNNLMQVFAGSEAGSLIRKLIALLAIPVIVGVIPALIYWIAKRKWFPYFMEFLWVTWLIQTAAIVMLYKPPA